MTTHLLLTCRGNTLTIFTLFIPCMLIELNSSVITTNTLLIYPTPMSEEPMVGQGLLIVEDSQSHSDTPHSVGLLWTSDQLVTENSTTQSTHNRQTFMPPVGFESTVPASERPQTHTLDLAATVTVCKMLIV